MKNKNNKLSADLKKDGMYSGKAGSAVEVETEKNGVNLRIEKEEPINEYYYKVAGRYRFVMFFSGFLFVAFLVAMIVIFKSEITYDNLMYALRDINTDVSTPSAGFDGLNLEEESKMSFGLYRERLAVATGSGYTLYNTAGSKEIHYSYYMENPKVLTSDKYTLVYDIGKNDYQIYNTLTKVLDKKHDYEVQGAALSKSGRYALISRSEENRFVVHFYDENFVNIYNSYKDSYIMDTALDSTGKKYVILSTDVEGIDFVTEIQTGKTDSEESKSVKITGYMPLKAYIFDNGSACAVCDKGIVFCDSNGEIVSKQDYNGFSILYSCVCGDRLVVAGSTDTVGNQNRMTVYDNSGSEIVSVGITGKLTAVTLGEEYAFYSISEDIVRVTFDGTTESEKTDVTPRQLIADGETVIVCSSEKVFSAFDMSAGEKSASIPEDTDTAQ